MAGIRTCDRESQVQRPNHYTTETPRVWGFPWDFHGYGQEMGMGTVISLHRLMGILWEFLYRCEIPWKRYKHLMNTDVLISQNSLIFKFTL